MTVVERLALTTERLCCEYARRDARDLRAEVVRTLADLSAARAGRCTLRTRQEFLVLAGWLTCLLACLDYDLGDARRADHARRVASSIGHETGHGEIVAWTFELSAWFALTSGRLHMVPRFAEAGMAAAPHSSVVVQLAAQAAKAHARMGDARAVHRTLDDGFRLLARHDRPTRPENHFVVEPAKWDFHAMDCYRLVGADRHAAAHANAVLDHSRRPDGIDANPMRAAEARLTLAVLAVRGGDLDAAVGWTARALSQPRRSVVPLANLVREVLGEARQRYRDGDRAALDVVRSSFVSLP
jgi:hypothetical protein